MTTRTDGAFGQRDAVDRWATLAAALPAAIIATGVAFTSLLFRDGDVGWHIASGRVILATGAVPHTDPLSFTFKGQPWVAHEWLSDVATAVTFDHAGWAGLAALSALCLGTALFVMARRFTCRIPVRWALILALLAPAVLLPFFHARPHVFAFPIIALWLEILLRARADNRAPPLGAALLIVLWANLHGSFIIGLGIAALLGLEALLAGARGRALRDWLLFGALCLAASLLTPHGIDALLFPFQVSNMALLKDIGEWRRTVPAEDPLFLILVVLSWVIVIWRRREAQPLRVLLIAGLTIMAFAHIRHQAMFAIVVPMLVADWAGRAGPLPRQVPHQALAVAMMTAVLVAVRLAIPSHPPDRRAYPMTAIASVPPPLRATPVLNEYSFGGPLTMQGIAPFIDGRADMYGDPFMANYLRIVRGNPAAFDAAVRRYGICWTIFPPKAGIIGMLDRRTDWHRDYEDDWAIVHVRDDCRKALGTEKGDPLRGRPSRSRAL